MTDVDWCISMIRSWAAATNLRDWAVQIQIIRLISKANEAKVAVSAGVSASAHVCDVCTNMYLLAQKNWHEHKAN